jgi:cell division protein FtsW
MSTVNYIQQKLQGDKVVWTVSILLMLISVLVVYSATGSLAYRKMNGDTESFLLRHSGFIVLAFLAMYLCHKIDYVYYSRLSRFALLASIPLLFFAWQFGTSLNEASRWITVPFINKTFQPSDFAKVALIANMASMLSKRQQNIEEFQRGIIPLMFWTGIICSLIGVTDWSSALLLFLTCMLLLFIGRVPVRYLGILLLVGMFSGAFAFAFGQRGQTVSSRLESYLSTTEMPYQAEQAKIAVATGGISGKGVGKSTQKSFLPHPYSDFIFAIILEEYGLLGGIVIIGLYLTLLYRGMVIAVNSNRAFGGLLAAGLIFALVVQALVNMAVVVGLVPVTGLPLPMLSMGGTSLVFTGISIGIVLSVSRNTEPVNLVAQSRRGRQGNVMVRRSS